MVTRSSDSLHPPRRHTTGGFPWRTALAVALGVFAALAAIEGLAAIGRAIGVLIISITIACALAPPTSYLARRIPRTLAAVLLFAASLGAVALIAWFIVPDLSREVSRFIDRAPAVLQSLRERIEQTIPIHVNLLQKLREGLGGLAQWILQATTSLASFVTGLLIILFLSFYWLLAIPALSRFTGSLFPPARARTVLDVLGRVGHAMGGYIRGTLLDATATSVLTYIGLRLIGVDFALPLAALMFLGEFIPYLGPVVAGLPGIAIAWTQSANTALWTTAMYVIVQQVEGQILVPNIMRHEVALPQWLVLIAIFAGGLIGGLLGILAAVPVAGALKVLVEDVFAPAIRQWTGASEQPAPQ